MIGQKKLAPQVDWALFHKYIVPTFSIEELRVLLKAVEQDDEELIQGLTILQGKGYSEKVIGACAIAYPIWKTRNLSERNTIEDLFEKRCYIIDKQNLHALSNFMDWFDVVDRETMLKELGEQLEIALSNGNFKSEESAQ